MSVSDQGVCAKVNSCDHGYSTVNDRKNKWNTGFLFFLNAVGFKG